MCMSPYVRINNAVVVIVDTLCITLKLYVLFYKKIFDVILYIYSVVDLFQLGVRRSDAHCIG